MSSLSQRLARSCFTDALKSEIAAYTLAPRFSITNSAILGTLFVPIGLGNILGSRFGGLYADWTVARWIAKRGYRRSEDRLYSTLVGGGLLVPGSMVAIGWLTETAKGGLGPVLVFVSRPSSV